MNVIEFVEERRVKVLFFDIDGTLIDGKRGINQIPIGVIDQLKRIQSMGHKIFICSGRPKKMLDEQFLKSYFDGYVLFNGGYVEIDGKAIFQNIMDYHVLVKLCSLLDELHAEYMVETADAIYINSPDTVLYHYFVGNGHKNMFTIEFDLDEVLHHAIKLECNNTNEDVEKIQKCISQHFSHTLGGDQHGTENSFEIFPSDISKAVGIEKVLEYYNIDKKDTYAFGDGLNDIEMFSCAGTSVAMGNAVDELKEIATLTCKAVNENGLEEILKELF